MPRWLIIVLAVAGLASAAVVEGLRSERWGESEDLRVAAAKLDRVPATFGDWTSTEVPQDPKVLKVAEAAGYVSRTYTHRKTKAQVTVLLLCGPSGPIGSHTPEVCYAGSGYAMRGDPQKKTVVMAEGGTATYWSARFEKGPESAEVPLRVCWMWGTDGDWTASANPRGEFALHRALYKLYVVRGEPTLPTESTTPDPVHAFLTDFLPEVKKALTLPDGPPHAK